MSERGGGGGVGREWGRLLLAVQVLTRLPTPVVAEVAPDWLARSARYFPLVGLGVGLVGAAVLLLARAVFGDGLVAPLLALGTTAALTGALHEDGLGDVFDSFGAADRERRLQILKDPRMGSFGVLALVIATGLKAAALAALSSPLLAVCGLLLAHGGGRAAAVWVMAATPHASASTSRLGEAERRPGPGELAFAGGCALLPLLGLGEPAGLIALLCGGAGAALLTIPSVRRLGGHTGDVLGAAEQGFEVGVLLALAALSR